MHHVHFIGIGGYSMSGLALALQAAGVTVTGSDARASSRTRLVERAGIPVVIGHRVDNIGQADTVVYNTDVPETNVERQAAVARGVEVVHRSEILRRVLAGHRTLLVTGTAGKTTTSAMAAVMLVRAGWDPLVLIGGELLDLGGATAVGGAGVWAVAEADESDGTFTAYQATVAVVTNLEPEHLEHYGGHFEGVERAMAAFLSRIPPEGTAVLGIDAPPVAALARAVRGRVETFALDQAADGGIGSMVPSARGSQFTVLHEGREAAWVDLPVPGRHNVANALAALAAAHAAGLPLAEAADSLRTFRGAKRRFERLAQVRGIQIVDDYAHHPAKVRAAVAAARQANPAGRVVAAFQPQRYSRTAQLWSGFVEVLGDADVTAITDIYAPPGERPIEGVTAERLARETAAAHPERVVEYVAGVDDVAGWLGRTAQPGDLVLTMGAGDIWRAAEAFRDGLLAEPPE